MQAALIVYRQLQLMRLHQDTVTLTFATALPPSQPSELTGRATGHLIYGSVLGAVYRRPVLLLCQSLHANLGTKWQVHDKTSPGTRVFSPERSAEIANDTVTYGKT